MNDFDDAPCRVWHFVACPNCRKETLFGYLDGESDDPNEPYCSAECFDEANPEEDPDE